MINIIDNLDEFYNKVSTLKEVEVDPVNWLTYFIDEKNGEKWVEERIYPEMQAGGPPRLRLLEKFPWE
jgi:hypothetical protein